MLFWCITSAGLLLSMQHKCERDLAASERPSLQQMERLFDAENRKLDREIRALLSDHRKAIEKRK